MFATANQYGKLVTMNYVYGNYKPYVNPTMVYKFRLALHLKFGSVYFQQFGGISRPHVDQLQI